MLVVQFVFEWQEFEDDITEARLRDLAAQEGAELVIFSADPLKAVVVGGKNYARGGTAVGMTLAEVLEQLKTKT